MSDSSLSSTSPSQATLEQALRHAVQRVYKLGNLEELTVKRIRTTAEEDLELKKDFFKSDQTWKDKSKTIIQSEVELHTEATSVGEPFLSQSSPKGSEKLPKPPNTKKPTAKSAKRASLEVGSKKRRKKADTKESVDSDSNGSAKPTRPIPKARKRASPTENPAPEKDMDEETKANRGLRNNFKPSETTAPDSGSEMSVVIDEEPKRKRKDRNSGAIKSTSRRLGGSKAAKAIGQSVDPDAEEIKKLQGWLIKCGIRKMWYKELAPHDTPKLKIRHLKEMLSEAGMTGRYSAEKATQIREERELKADLEAVQEGDKHWGKAESEEEEGTTKPRRRLARGLKELDFLNDDDGAETD